MARGELDSRQPSLQRAKKLLLLTASCGLWACTPAPDDAPTADAGVTSAKDASPPKTQTMDARVPDAQTQDADTEDATVQDAQVQEAGEPTQIGGISGPFIPCEGESRSNTGTPIDWTAIPPTGVIGQNSAGQDIPVYIRDACPGQSTVRTVVIGASLHGSEPGGQNIAHELVFNRPLPADVRVIIIPEINRYGIELHHKQGAAWQVARLNKNGVDLNRNFDYLWDQANANYGTKGSGPASEPETQAVQSFLSKVGKASLIISYHDSLNWVAASGPHQDQSDPMAQRYSVLAEIELRDQGNSPGFLESWYANATGTPAVLVELSNTATNAYFLRHANAIVTMLEEGTIK